jgi:hypothetical protein
MAMPEIERAHDRATDETIDLDFEETIDRAFGFDAQIVLEQAVFAELSAIARTSPANARAGRGFRALDPAARPS